MTLVSRDITIVAADPTPVRDVAPGVWRCVEIYYGPTERVFSLSHPEAQSFMPAGAVYVGALKSVSDYSQNCGYLSGRATITAPSYTFVDKDFELSEFIRDKAINGRGSLNTIIREYEWPAWSPFPVNTLNETLMHIEAKGTWIFENHTWSAQDNIVVQCKDINRGLDTEIFNPYQWKVNGSVSATENFIPIDLAAPLIDEQDVLFTRGQHYNQFPSERGFFVKLQTGEKIFCTGIEERSGVVGLVVRSGGRGQLNTTAEAITIASDTEPANFPSATEYVLIDETVQTMAYALATGVLPNGELLPKHWSAQVPTRWINRYSYAIYAHERRLKFEDPGSQNAKRWIESEVLSADAAVHAIDNQGRLTWTPVITPTDLSAGQILLDKSNCQNIINYKLRHDKSQIHTSVVVEFNHNPDDDSFATRAVYDNPDSVDFNGLSKTRTVQFKGIHDGIHTASQVRKLGEAIGDDNFYEKQFIDVECLIPDIRLGTLVAVDFPHIRDDAGSTGELKRTMIVTASRERRSDRVTTYTLTGTQQIASSAFAGNALHNLPVEEYRRDGIDITTLPGVNLTGDRITGSITLTMGQKYYYVNDANPGTGLEWGPGLTVNIAGSGQAIQWWCFGPWINNSTIDLTGRSNNEGGEGQTTDTPQMLGDPGIIVSGRAGGSLRLNRIYGVRSVSVQGNPRDVFSATSSYEIQNRSSRIAAISFPRLPAVALDANNGQLSGIPANLGGMGGTGGPLSVGFDPDRQPRSPNGLVNPSPVTTRANGGKGGTGGGGFVSVSWGGANNGQIITTGNRASVPPSSSIVGQDYYGGEGAPGAPGAWLEIIDGNYTPMAIDGTTFIARHGAPRLTGEGVNNFSSRRRTSTTLRSNLGPQPADNLWQEAHRVAYTPAVENVQTYNPVNEIDLFFQNQRDGKVKIIVSDVDPSNANEGDMRISQAELDNGGQFPNARVLQNGVWRDLDWNTDNRVYEFLLFTRREFGGSEVHFGTTRPTDFEDGDLWRNPDTDTTVILRTNGQDEIFTRSGAQLGDERGRDPNLSLTRDDRANGVGFEYYYGTSDPNELPAQLVLGGAPQGGTLQPPRNVGGVVFSATTGEIIFNFPFDGSVTKYGIFLDGSRIAEVTGGSYTYSGLTASTTYQFGVRSENDSGETSEVVNVTVTTFADDGGGGGGGGTGIPAPSDLSFTAYSTTSGELFWTRSIPETSIDGYRVYRDGVVLGTTDGNSFFMSDMSPATQYNFSVVAYVGSTNESTATTTTGTTQAGASSAPVIQSITVTGDGWTVGTPPTGGTTVSPPRNPFTFTAYDSTSGQLAWVRATDETSIDGYRIYRDNVAIGTTTGNTFEQTGLTASTTYNYRVVSYSGGNESAGLTIQGTTQSGGGGGGTTNGLVVVSNGPTVTLSGHAGLNDRGIFFEFRSGDGTVLHTQTVNMTNQSVSYLPPNPTSYATFTAFGQDTNNVGHSLPGQPLAYQS